MFYVPSKALINKRNTQEKINKIHKCRRQANDAACNWWLFISPFLNKIIKTLIKQHCHFTLYRCPRAVKEDSPTRLSFFCLMFTSLASEPTPNRLILRRSWRCCWQTRPFTIASTGPTQRSSRLLDGLIWGAAFTSVLFGNWKHGCFYFGMEIQISLGFFF